MNNPYDMNNIPPAYMNNSQNYERQLPPVQPLIFINSAGVAKELINDAYTITNHIENNPQFSRQLMTYAQHGQKNEVLRMLNSLQLKHRPEVVFTPGALLVKLFPSNPNDSSSALTITMLWHQAF
jgi:hypothetical protein